MPLLALKKYQYAITSPYLYVIFLFMCLLVVFECDGKRLLFSSVGKHLRCTAKGRSVSFHGLITLICFEIAAIAANQQHGTSRVGTLAFFCCFVVFVLCFVRWLFVLAKLFFAQYKTVSYRRQKVCFEEMCPCENLCYWSSPTINAENLGTDSILKHTKLSRARDIFCCFGCLP